MAHSPNEMILKSEYAAKLGRNALSFFREVHSREKLMQELAECGYSKEQKLLTPKQQKKLDNWYLYDPNEFSDE